MWRNCPQFPSHRALQYVVSSVTYSEIRPNFSNSVAYSGLYLDWWEGGVGWCQRWYFQTNFFFFKIYSPTGQAIFLVFFLHIQLLHYILYLCTLFNCCWGLLFPLQAAHIRCSAAPLLFFPLLLLLWPLQLLQLAALSAAPRFSAAGCSDAAPLLWAALTVYYNCCCSSAAAAGCVQDNSLYRLSALAGTRTCTRTIGTSQPALSS